jgi:hypothetical protein
MIAVDKLDLANRSDREIILTLPGKLIDKISQHGLSLPHAHAHAHAHAPACACDRNGLRPIRGRMAEARRGFSPDR